MLRSARHAKILEIISSKEIETQEELCEEFFSFFYFFGIGITPYRENA